MYYVALHELHLFEVQVVCLESSPGHGGKLDYFDRVG